MDTLVLVTRIRVFIEDSPLDIHVHSLINVQTPTSPSVPTSVVHRSMPVSKFKPSSHVTASMHGAIATYGGGNTH